MFWGFFIMNKDIYMKRINKIAGIGLTIAAALLSAQMSHAAVFQINGVASWDTLNMRAQPGAKNAIVTKIPFNGKYIRATGKRQTVGKTVWTQVTWQGKTGWVSQRYIRPMPAAPQTTVVQQTAVQRPVVTNTPAAPAPRAVQRTTAVAGSKGKWVLECGNRSPFWRTIVHPKALDVNLRGRPAGMIPITYEKQRRNKWNTAMKTELKSSNGRFTTDLTIKYTKQCLHTLSNQKVHYRVEALINGETLNGCCKAVRIQ
ncbi:SH3 domain-containing protein [Leucothrix sargassi]|nr:SH3 domain-containing protein [Leucothrix sargassi]